MSNELVKTDLPLDTIMNPRIIEISEALKNYRKRVENKQTPAQYLDIVPKGGKSVLTVKGTYLLDKTKEFCHELFVYQIHPFQIVDLKNKDGSFYGQAIVSSVTLTDQITGNTVIGGDAALVQTSNQTGEPIDFSANVSAAVSLAMRQCAKYLGISADTFEREVKEYSPELQNKINDTWELIRKRFGTEETKNFNNQLRARNDRPDKEIDEFLDAWIQKVNGVKK